MPVTRSYLQLTVLGTVGPVQTEVRRDRRDSRWDEHRRARREHLVQATIAAVTTHGAGVGMDDIAAAAGTSKTVLYRHFTNRDELYLAVCTRIGDQLTATLAEAMAGLDHPRAMTAAAIEAYLAFIEADPELYRFVVHPQAPVPGSRDPISTLADLVGERATDLLAAALSAAGRPTGAAGPWGHGLVGLVRAAADRWLQSADPMPRTELAGHLTALAWTGLAGVIAPPAPVEEQ